MGDRASGTSGAATAAGQTRPVIDIRGLSLTFQTDDKPVVALDGIDLKIEAGDFVSLIGPSGCGKTTLLRVIADLERPTGGTALIDGMSPEGRGSSASTAMCSRPRRCSPGARSSAT